MCHKLLQLCIVLKRYLLLILYLVYYYILLNIRNIKLLPHFNGDPRSKTQNGRWTLFAPQFFCMVANGINELNKDPYFK